MKKIILPWTALLGGAISIVISSCAYDPYYSSAGSYYGSGHGYGSSSFSTSLFVTTGDPRWGYDPHTYCYYDYRSRRYYDPYLYGYYPVGYRPYAVYGVPHPYGWRQGHGHCPPPRTVRNVTVVNYRDRESAYRNSNYSWARQVKQRPAENSYRQPREDSRQYNSRQPDYRTDSRTRPSSDRNTFTSRTWSPREYDQTREYTPNSRGDRDRIQRDDYRPTDRSSKPQFGRTDSQQKTRESRSESSRSQSIQRPQENRSRGGERQRGQEPPADSREKKTERKGLRSLGDA